jgi:hypothetical protein
VEELYATVSSPMLSDINHHFLTRICERLEISTPITWSSDYRAEGTRTERLLDLCRKAGACEYVSGPAARAYLEESLFAREGISVSWFEYGPYEEYSQVHPPFELHVSILDVLFNAGEDAVRLVRPAARV